MDKLVLRKELREKLQRVADKKEQSKSIAQKVKNLKLPEGSICIYNALPTEVDTQELIEYFLEKRQVFLPVVKGEDIVLVEITKDTRYVTAKWDIREPVGEQLAPESVNPRVTITPLLGVDKDFNRLGKGKGFYDRYFDKVDTVKIGIAFNEQLVDSITCDKWDKKLDAIITPDLVLIKDKCIDF